MEQTKKLLTIGLTAYFVIVVFGFILGAFYNDTILMNRVFIMALSVCVVMVYVYLINTHEERSKYIRSNS